MAKNLIDSTDIVRNIENGDVSLLLSEEIKNTLQELSEKGTIYSTDEVLTNDKWIDGRPIYRKVMTFTGTVPANISTGLIDVQPIKMEAIIQANVSTKDGGYRNVPWLFNSTTTSWQGGFYYRPSNGNIAFQVGSDLGDTARGYIIMEYVK